MAEDKQSLFKNILDEVFWLHRKWHEYVVLFGTKPSRIDLMNEAASNFFGMLQPMMYEDIILHIARIVDNPCTGSKRNLTINSLADHFPGQKVPEHIGQLISEAKKATEFCTDWRNRHIAHRDRKLLMDDKAEPLPVANRIKIKSAIESIHHVINAISIHDGHGEILCNHEPRTGAMSLIYVLHYGVLAQQDESDRLAAGEFTNDPESYDL